MAHRNKTDSGQDKGELAVVIGDYSLGKTIGEGKYYYH
jgi:hypothetical protein